MISRLYFSLYPKSGSAKPNYNATFRDELVLSVKKISVIDFLYTKPMKEI